jgi:hypothetical protein
MASTSGGGGGGFERLAAQLYCAGAMDQACPGGKSAGQCNWLKAPSWTPVSAAEVSKDESVWARNAKRLASDRWDPRNAWGSDFRLFNPESAAKCVRGKRFLIAGDSTTRDTYYEFMAVAGNSIQAPLDSAGRFRATSPRQYWPPGAWEPRMPGSSGGRDIRGACMGNFNKERTCVREEPLSAGRSGANGSAVYQFLTKSNSSWEVQRFADMLSARPGALDAAFVQCSIYEWLKPDVYNYNLTNEQRHREEVLKGPVHFKSLGSACLDYIQRVVWSHSPKARVFLLGTTPLPMWTRNVGGPHVEAIVFRSIHHGLGLHCKRGAGGAWEVESRRGILPVDRFATVGPRRRDAIHPFFNAQFAIVQMMFNYMCPDKEHRGAKLGVSQTQ